MTKAQKGDLIRIIKEKRFNDDDTLDFLLGDIYEVIEVDRDGDVNFHDADGELRYINDHSSYVIHRKAGEEDDANLTQLEPSKWSDTQENLIRLACSELADLLVRKNHDYGDSFSQQYEKYGLMSALIRMDDKMRRLETLQGGEQAQVAESVGDTLQDLAGYALLAYVESKKK